MKNKIKHHPLVRCPGEVVGTWKGYDIVLKSNNVVEDAWKFDLDAEELTKWLSEKLTKQ